MTEVLDRIRGAMVGLKMPRALEALDHTMQKLEQGEITAIEAIDSLLSEEYSTRETRRIDVALRTSKLLPIKTLESFDFSFQPSAQHWLNWSRCWQRQSGRASWQRRSGSTHDHLC